jgi:hypothetical protein
MPIEPPDTLISTQYTVYTIHPFGATYLFLFSGIWRSKAAAFSDGRFA